MSAVPSDSAVAAAPVRSATVSADSPPGSGRGRRILRRVLAQPMGRIGAALVALVVILAIFGPWLTPYNPIAIRAPDRFAAPSLEHWLGADQLGRDVLSRIIAGTRTAMTVAVAGIGMALVAGLVLGLLAGYGPRFLDLGLMLACDAVISLPMILFALAVVTLYGPSLQTILIVVAVFMTPAYFRVVRSQTLVLKRSEYVLAARAMGASPLRVVLRHVLPNMAGPLLVLVAMDVPAVIAVESGLSFLGQGVRPPTPSWGGIINDGYSFIGEAPHIVAAAGLPVILATIGFTLLGEALRDALDPRVRGRT
ncbi:ABC transporter permease [Zavarzinia sp. CC-PAN008]|uniref:ABC transporter permease n=1 Tax=Zavarzinia sp. CC-PAN008 TaxID=3243332 RepID=UPI003F74990F